MEFVADPIAFFADLGGLHDARVEWLSWGDSEVRLVVNNLNSNFMDGDQPSPDYPGYTARPATLVFSGVDNISGHVRIDIASISSLDVESWRDCYRVAIIGTASWMVAFEFVAVAVEAAGEPASVARHYAMLKA